jgi:Lrp/AsnC family leucine-responsive transcriptional regulator
MSFDRERLLDDTGWELLRLLQENARTPFAELGRRVGLSAPGVADRVRRLEDAGIITGYRAQVSVEKIGAPIMAFVLVSSRGKDVPRFLALAQRCPEVLECHQVTGIASYIMKVVTSSVGRLGELLERLEAHSEVTTTVVLSSPIPPRTIGRASVSADGGAHGPAR